MNKNIRIVLVNTSHPGNIGAVARAMKTMELDNLYLVNPKIFPDVNATAMASGADNILENATVTKSLKDALAGTQIVFGTTARPRELQLPPLNPKEAAKLIDKKSKNNNVAVVFGRENNGLSNEELEMCNYHLYIPTNPNFSSLNIAAAVQLIVYEISCATSESKTFTTPKVDLANTEEMSSFYEHLEETLLSISFLQPNNQKTIMPKLKRLFNRNQLEKSELNILRGILSSINYKIRR